VKTMKFSNLGSRKVYINHRLRTEPMEDDPRLAGTVEEWTGDAEGLIV
jgi:hypothetical protein